MTIASLEPISSPLYRVCILAATTLFPSLIFSISIIPIVVFFSCLLLLVVHLLHLVDPVFDELAQMTNLQISKLIEVVTQLSAWTKLRKIVVQRFLWHSNLISCIFQRKSLMIVVFVVVAIVKTAPLGHFLDHVSYCSLFGLWLVEHQYCSSSSISNIIILLSRRQHAILRIFASHHPIQMILVVSALVTRLSQAYGALRIHHRWVFFFLFFRRFIVFISVLRSQTFLKSQAQRRCISYNF